MKRDKTKEVIISNLKNGIKLNSEQQSWIKDKLKQLDSSIKENIELKYQLNELKAELTKLELLLSSSIEQTRQTLEVLSRN